MTVLLLEDNSLVADFVVETLNQRGQAVIHARTVAQALAIYRDARQPFTVLLCDYELPDGTGLDFFAGIKQTVKPGRVGAPERILWSALDREAEIRASGVEIEHIFNKNQIAEVLTLIERAYRAVAPAIPARRAGDTP